MVLKGSIWSRSCISQLTRTVAGNLISEPGAGQEAVLGINVEPEILRFASCRKSSVCEFSQASRSNRVQIRSGWIPVCQPRREMIEAAALSNLC
jgi:hypothetical protein